MTTPEYSPTRFGQILTFRYKDDPKTSVPMIVLGPQGAIGTGIQRVLWMYPSGAMFGDMSGLYQDHRIEGYELVLDTPKEGTR